VATETVGLHPPDGCAAEAERTNDPLVVTEKRSGFAESGTLAPVFCSVKPRRRNMSPLEGMTPATFDGDVAESTCRTTPALAPPLLDPELEPPLLDPVEPPPSTPGDPPVPEPLQPRKRAVTRAPAAATPSFESRVSEPTAPKR
jgi:hypothetical protein